MNMPRTNTNLPSYLQEEAMKIYGETSYKGLPDRVAVERIQDLLKEKGITVHQRTIYNYVNRFKGSNIQPIIDRVSVDLSWQNEMTKEVSERLFKRFKEADEKEKPNQREVIEWARALKELIDLSIKIDTIRGKKEDKTGNNTQQVGIFINTKDGPGRLEDVTVIEHNNLNEASYG